MAARLRWQREALVREHQYVLWIWAPPAAWSDYGDSALLCRRFGAEALFG